MALKIYLNDQIHRVSKLPQSLNALISLIKTLFEGYLPQSWTVHYMDQDGDSITVSHEHDYGELVNQETNAPSLTIKLYIVAAELGNSQRSLRQEEEKSRGEFRRPREFGEAKHLMKKLMKGDLSDSERSEVTRQLEEVKSQFTSEERARFEAKSQRFEQKRGWKKGMLGEGEERPGLFDRFRMMLGWKAGGHGHGHHKGHHHHHGRGDGFSKFGMLSEIKAKVEKQTPEKAPVILKSAENFVKLFKAKKHGKSEKAKECQVELISSLPVENRKTFEELLSAIPEDLEKHELKESLISVAKMYYQVYCPENNNIFEELEEMRKERKAKKTHFKHMMKDKRGKSIDWEKKQELKAKYSKFTLRAALMLKTRLPGEDIEKLCEFVKQSPYDLSFEQLLENYNPSNSAAKL